MYNLQKNDYHQNPKASNIQTPPAVSQFIFELLRDKIENLGIILDPGCGQRNLLKPWERIYHLFGYDTRTTYGIDIEESSEADLVTDFFTLTKPRFELDCFTNRKGKVKKKLILVLCNPPFNGYKGKTAAEVWLDKIIELFGKDIPIVLFAPYNFRLPWKSDSKRLSKFLKGEYPPIASIISLPTKGLWEGVTFHSEILIFNIPNLQPHYFFNPTNQLEQRTPI